MNLALNDLPADSRTPQQVFTARSGGFGAAVVRTIRLWRARIRERWTLVELSDRDLRDLGMSRWEFEYSRSNWFWQPNP